MLLPGHHTPLGPDPRGAAFLRDIASGVTPTISALTGEEERDHVCGTRYAER